MAIATTTQTVDTKQDLGCHADQAVIKDTIPVVETSFSEDDASKNGVSSPSTPPLQKARSVIHHHLEHLDPLLREFNRQIHSNPEVAYKEFFAHDTLASFLEKQGFVVKKHAYGLETSFEAEIGQGGRLVVFCAEYDALPGIGHACGHNLIATSSLAGFLGAVQTLKELNLPGRIRILGTPAEEGGGGKVKLIEAGAFNPPEDIAAAIMAHPVALHQIGGEADCFGLAAFKLIASHKFRVEFSGKTAHAAGEPWKGRNALDAAVAAYSSVALLRQQIQPDERMHGIIEVGGTVPNVIPEYTRMNWYIRSPTNKRCDELLKRVKTCLEAAAAATDCSINYIAAPTYQNLRANETLCQTFVDEMAALDKKVLLHVTKAGLFNASTDMGNVSHLVPSFHGAFVIPTDPDVAGHNPKFAASAGTDEGHVAAINCAKGMAMLAIRTLLEDKTAAGARKDFETDDD
ncbi:unnamed protein product [Clonostachys rosea]|uniref:Peptidase M20 domain-containing protein 2 n=1 Tax=Bionectria ochroleuca TaxID=29856 RepID=A0ABY6V5R2_BIOOC|nr:unnamed protein product [Clonostachys rosea]